MKKFISMVMAAAMVVSLVPATAFAASSYDLKATASIVNAWEKDDTFNGVVDGLTVPELKLKVTEAKYQQTSDTIPTAEFEMTLDNADFAAGLSTADVTVKDSDGAILNGAANAANGTAQSWDYTAVDMTNTAAVKDMLISIYYDGVVPTGLKEVPIAWLNTNQAVKGGFAATAAQLTTTYGITAPTDTPASLLNAAIDAYLTSIGSADDHTDYTFVANSPMYGENVYVANPGADQVYFTKAAVEAYAANAMPPMPLEVTDAMKAAWATTALATMTGSGNYASRRLAVESHNPAQNGGVPATNRKVQVVSVVRDADDHNVVTVTIKGYFVAGDTIAVDLKSAMDKYNVGKVATVAVTDGDFNVDAEELTYVSVLDKGIKASLAKIAEVAEEETTNLERDLKIETTVGYFAQNQVIELKLSNGFEWTNALVNGGNYNIVRDADNEDTAIITVTAANQDKITVAKASVEIDAVSAKVGDVAKITVKAKDNVTDAFKATADAVEAVKVVGDTVTMSVDEDEDLPVIYSGVNVNNDGITDDSDHVSLKVTLKESVKEALDEKKAFTLTLPEGVYATDVNVTTADDVQQGDNTPFTMVELEDAFKAAYKKGEQETFEFARKTFGDSAKPFEIEFEMTLIAEPGFEGDVTLTLAGDGFEDEQEVKIAKFVAPFTVEAAQNDLIIDYRNTEVPTDIVIKEAEAGLWSAAAADAMEFIFDIDRMEFEKDATITVDKDSDMEVKALKGYDLGFKVTEESDDEAAVITISDISLYMGRSLAAGAYDLDLWTNAGQWMLTTDKLFTTDKGEKGVGNYYVADFIDADYDNGAFDAQYYTVKEGFVNIVTAGRDQDDASFTKKVVVPVGETKMYSGEKEIALDVPAYINADGYTMLPVRAVAVALGVSNEAVQWDPATKTVIIMYGNRVITMTAGQKVIYATGTAIPARSAVEIKDGRAFLGLRDLATALGVTTVNYDAATKTATLN